MIELDLTKWQSNGAYKKKFVIFVCLVCSLIVVNFSVIHALNDKYFLSSINFLAFIVLINFGLRVAIFGKPPSRVGMMFSLLILTFCISVSIFYIGVLGVLWSFPLIVFSSFSLSKNMALGSNVAIILLISISCYFNLSLGDLVRVIVALTGTVIFSSIFSHQLRTAQKRLELLSMTDPMTGALNRQTLDQSLLEHLYSDRKENETSVVAIFDLDDFKDINDKSGHLEGDKAIVELVRIIKENTRETDLVFRLGGDEILLLLNHLNRENCSKILSNIREKVEASIAVRTTTSVGAAVIDNHSSVSSWLDEADKALYRAKADGKNTLHFNFA